MREFRNSLRPFLSLIALLLSLPHAAQAEQKIWLSSLDITNAVQGYGKPQADKSVDGHAITLDGHTFLHGFGTHAPGLLAIDLHGGTSRFTAMAGIDDEVGQGRGNVEFQVLGDGHKILWRSGILHQGEPSVNVNIPLAGVKQIILRVTTGGKAYDFDHADWADAQFIVTGALPTAVSLKAADPIISMKNASLAPHINAPYGEGIHPGTPFLWTVPVSGERPLHFTAEGLPPGLSLNEATGTLTGTIASAGDFRFSIAVSNQAGNTSHTIHILSGPSLALTPPMGWNSYDAFGDSVTEAEVMANANYVAANMQPYGWDTIVVDYRWYDPGAHDNNANARAGAALTMDACGRLLPSPNRFPSAADGAGFKALADKVHALGLKFGIHIMRGIPRNAVKANLPIEGSSFTASEAADTSDICPWCQDMYGVRGDTSAGQAYYDSIFRLYASWGVDYVKMDDTSAPYHTDEINAVHDAIEKCGRSIVYSLSPGETPIADAAHVAAHANLWRVSGDFWDSWEALDHEFALGERWQKIVGPGHWSDADMLPLGHLSINNRSVGPDRRTSFTRAEQVTLLSLWSLLPSPLMVGANLPDNDPFTLALLTNPEVLAVNQDALGAAGSPGFHTDQWQVWSKNLADGSVAIGVFNRGDFNDTTNLTASDLGLTGKYRIRDLWRRKDLGLFKGVLTLPVPAHGAVLLRFIMVPDQK